MAKFFSLVMIVTLAACASASRSRTGFSPPARSLSHEELIAAIPPDLYRGDIAGLNRENSSASEEYLDFVFLKNEPTDQVPMRVAVYSRTKDILTLEFTAPTPFSPGDCHRGECRARISVMPGGFQISRESFGADHLRADYRFVRDGKDLKLIGKGYQVRRPGGASGKAGACSLYYDYVRKRILHRQGEESHFETMAEQAAPHLNQDKLRFDSASPESLCAP